MKKSYCLIFGLLTVMTFSCKKTEKLCCTVPQSNHMETAQRNGILYETPDIHGILNTDSLTISSAGQAGVTDNDFVLDSLSVKLKYTGPGTYKLSANQVYYFIRLSEKVPYAPNTPVTTYMPDPAFNNSISVTSYDQSTNIMSGTFNVKFLDPNTAADISILNGTFKFPVGE